MKNNLTMTVLASAFALVLSNSAVASATVPAGELPILKPGNFVSSSDQQICFDIFKETYTSDMVGFKVDSGPKICDADGNCTGQQAGDFTNGEVTFDVSDDSKYLSWTALPGVQMLAVIVKGGTNHNLYDYLNAPPADNPYLGDNDSGLHAPLTKSDKLAGISHYNVCYRPDQGGEEQGEGCSPGYWGNHTDRWFGAATTDGMNTTFGVDYFSNLQSCTKVKGVETCTDAGPMKLLDAFNPNQRSACPSCSSFALHAVAALLNSYGGTDNGDVSNAPIPYPDGDNINSYPWTTAEVIADVKAVDDGIMTEAEFKTKYDIYGDYNTDNKLWCPLTGTKATN